MSRIQTLESNLRTALIATTFMLMAGISGWWLATAAGEAGLDARQKDALGSNHEATTAEVAVIEKRLSELQASVGELASIQKTQQDWVAAILVSLEERDGAASANPVAADFASAAPAPLSPEQAEEEMREAREAREAADRAFAALRDRALSEPVDGAPWASRA